MADEEKQQDNSTEKVVGRPFPPGVSGNPNGRPAGSKNYKTRFREILEKWASFKLPPVYIKSLIDRGVIPKEFIPVGEAVTFEEIEALVVHLSAIERESWAYDRLYDKPQQHTDLTSLGDKLIQRVYNISEPAQKEKLEQLHNDANGI